HVRDGRALGDGERGQAVARELDELVDDALLAEELGEREYKVGRGSAHRELALELHADDDGPREVRRLAEHRGLGLDAADAPAEHAEPVDHRGVRVGAEERVRHRDAVAHDDDLREPLEIHLVADPGTGRNDAEGLEGLARPAEERVALAVALVLALEIALMDVLCAKEVGLDGVFDDQVDRVEEFVLRCILLDWLTRYVQLVKVDRDRSAVAT